MLIGHYFVKVTEKGRTALPKKFREEIGETGIVAKWYESCLVVVGLAKWQNLLAKLTAKSEFVTEPVRDTDRFILGSAFEVEMDSQGRFVVPKVLRDFARLFDEVVFLGLGDRIEIWNKKNWIERESYIQKNAGNMIEKIAKQKRGEGNG